MPDPDPIQQAVEEAKANFDAEVDGIAHAYANNPDGARKRYDTLILRLAAEAATRAAELQREVDAKIAMPETEESWAFGWRIKCVDLGIPDELIESAGELVQPFMFEMAKDIARQIRDGGKDD